MLKAIFIIVCINFLLIAKSMEKLPMDDNFLKNYEDRIARDANQAWAKNGIDYIAKAPDKCCLDTEVGPFCNYLISDPKWGISKRPFFFKNFHSGVKELDNIQIINQTKHDLATLNSAITEEYVRKISTLLYAIDSKMIGMINIHHKSEVKFLIWNRILLAKEAYGDLLKMREPFKPNYHTYEYYMEGLKISTVYTQLAHINKEHISTLWENTYPDRIPYAPLEKDDEYQEWLHNKSPGTNFLSLIVDIFAPITDNIIRKF